VITRRTLFLGAAAVITTPGLLMPVRKLIVPKYGRSVVDQIISLAKILDEQPVNNQWVFLHPELHREMQKFVDEDLAKGGHTTIVRGDIGSLDGRIRIIKSWKLT
jgi:hypothetical protein